MQLTEADPALLLQELAWARRLALHLTRDESLADDLAQEAFVMAHVKPPRPDQPLRPWLGRVVKNLFLMQLRGNGRRMRREDVHAAARTESANTEELLVRIEAQRRLVGLVQTLEEPMRTTLLLHYYEGLTCADIARRLDVPAGTIRWRLKTGLDRLRDRLDDSYGKRALWMAALAPKFERPPMNPITPLLKTGLLVTLGVGAAVALVTTQRATPHASTPAVVASQAVALLAPAPTVPTAAAKQQTAPKCTGETCAHEEALPDLILTSVEGTVTLDDDKLRALAQCFVGPDTQGRIDFQVSVTGSDTKRTVVSATPLDGDRESSGLHHPALEACAVDAFKGAGIEVAASFPASQRVTVLAGNVARCDGEPPTPPAHVIDGHGTLDTLPAIGPANAPVTLVEYNDFQCVFCARLAHTVEELAQRYPTQLRIVFRNAPLPMHANAPLAARAGIAAHLQGRFWPMHDLLFANQQKLDRASLLDYARVLGLDMARFTAALDSQAVSDTLARDVDAHARLGVDAAPVMTINGKTIVGSRPADDIAKEIDDALAE